MMKKETQKICVGLFLVCCCLFIFGCQTTGSEMEAEPEEEDQELHILDIEYDTFQKVVGWLSNDTLLVHIGDNENHKIISHNLLNGENETIYENASYFLTITIHSSNDKIMIQEVKNNESTLNLVNLNGETTHSISLDYNGYVTVDWNTLNENFIFISHYIYDEIEEVETSQVLVWNIEENDLVENEINSLYPKWYSSNLYLYINQVEDESLYIGDRREENDDLLIDTQTSDFFLYDDTFIGVVESDIQNDQLYLFHEYPFLTEETVLTIPKVTMNDEPVMPHLTQANRNGKIMAVLPDYSFALEEEIGEYTLAELDFQEEEINMILSLPQDSPILLSPNEDFLLYGWRYEYIIQLDNPEVLPLINTMI